MKKVFSLCLQNIELSYIECKKFQTTDGFNIIKYIFNLQHIVASAVAPPAVALRKRPQNLSSPSTTAAVPTAVPESTPLGICKVIQLLAKILIFYHIQTRKIT